MVDSEKFKYTALAENQNMEWQSFFATDKTYNIIIEMKRMVINILGLNETVWQESNNC